MGETYEIRLLYCILQLGKYTHIDRNALYCVDSMLASLLKGLRFDSWVSGDIWLVL